MDQSKRRIYLIQELQNELEPSKREVIPENETEQEKLLRKLMNIRPAEEISDDFLAVQDIFLQRELSKKDLTSVNDLKEVESDLYLWQGDITSLQADAIVNAANSDLLGCFIPNHNCIDNIIHTNAGIQLRLACSEITQKQGRKEAVGKAKITKGFNLPADYVIHTIGPYINSKVSPMKKDLLASSYMESLKLADKYQLESVAFCCISTGVFRFPNDQAAEIAVNTVKKYKKETNSDIKVIFNVFKNLDLYIYEQLLNE